MIFSKKKNQAAIPDLSVVGSGIHGEFLSHKRLYVQITGQIPNSIAESEIDVERFKLLFLKTYQQQCWNSYYNRRAFDSHEISKYDDVYYFLLKDVLVYLNHRSEDVHILFSQTQYKYVSRIHKLLLTCMKPKEMDKPFINIMNTGRNGLELTRLEIKRTDLEIETHYNDDFLQADRTIKKRLNKDMDKGIILLHGEPGTGKTTYIKHLIAQVNKDVIFMPPNIAADLTSPALMTLLLDKPNSILVIEDAENIVTSRDHQGNSPVSAILNLSDGILSDCLNIQIICSFNTDLKNVDKALLRRGRLIAKYEFGKLDVEKSNSLSRKLGFDRLFTEPQILTDIFNQEEQTFQKLERRAIGF
ncbi:AAA family ATPase [Nonlabens antarcticus]|uniref:AAA family ATPase n=1 Tax=Nonlabens antarcticus TaxID=392714 RepID=UPI001890EAF1|nr:AAA family ATPase [Nonlabens antarcticus]